MVKIIFKEGREGEMKLSAIEGIAVPRLDGKIALVYPRVNKLPLLNRGYTVEWGAPEMSEVEALYANFSIAKTRTDELFALGSPAAKFVRSFGEEFNLVDLLDASAIHKQMVYALLSATIRVFWCHILRSYMTY